MFYCKNYKHVRPMRFTILCTPTDSSDKSPIDVWNWCLLYCSACLHPNTTLMEADWTTVPCRATNLSILIQYVNHLQRQSVISVALKTPLEIRLGICIYETSLLHQPDDYIGLTPSCPSHILQQNCAHDCTYPELGVLPTKLSSCFFNVLSEYKSCQN